MGFAADCFNYCAILGEIFIAEKVLNATVLQLAVLGSLYALAYTITCPLSGYLADRVNKRWLCLLSVGGVAVTFWITPQLTSIWSLCAVSALRAAFIGFMWPPLMAWMTQTCPGGILSKRLGGYNVSWAVGMSIGYYIAGFLFQNYGGPGPFLFSLIFACCLFVFIAVFTPEEACGEDHPHALEAADVPFFVRQGMLMVTIGCFIGGLVLYVFPKVAGSAVSEQSQGLLHAARMGGQVLAFMLFTHMSTWHFKQWPPLVSLACFAVGMVIVALFGSLASYATGFVLIGFAIGVGYSMSIFYTLLLVQNKGMGGGIQETLIGLGNLLGPIYGGLLAWQFSPRVGVMLGILPLILVLPLTLYRRVAPAPNSAAPAG